MKVTLFFGYGHFLVVKMLFALPEIWAHVGPRAQCCHGFLKVMFRQVLHLLLWSEWS